MSVGAIATGRCTSAPLPGPTTCPQIPLSFALSFLNELFFSFNHSRSVLDHMSFEEQLLFHPFPDLSPLFFLPFGEDLPVLPPPLSRAVSTAG